MLVIATGNNSSYPCMRTIYCMCYFSWYAFPSGVVSEVSLYDSVPEEIDLYWECVPGEIAHAVNDSHARVAAIVARGNDEHTVTQLLDRVANACVVRVASVSRD